MLAFSITAKVTIVNNMFRQSHSVDNSCGLTPSRTRGRINVRTYFYMKSEYLPSVHLGQDLIVATEPVMPASQQCSIVTMGLSCLVFEVWPRDGQRTDGRRTDVDKHRISGPQVGQQWQTDCLNVKTDLQRYLKRAKLFCSKSDLIQELTIDQYSMTTATHCIKFVWSCRVEETSKWSNVQIQQPQNSLCIPTQQVSRRPTNALMMMMMMMKLRPVAG